MQMAEELVFQNQFMHLLAEQQRLDEKSNLMRVMPAGDAREAAIKALLKDQDNLGTALTALCDAQDAYWTQCERGTCLDAGYILQ